MLLDIQMIQKNVYKGLRSSFLFCSQYVDYFIFVIILMSKLLLFEAFSGASFTQKWVLEYLTVGLFELIFKGNDSIMQQGIFLVSLGAVLILTSWTLFLLRNARVKALLVIDIIVTLIIFSDLIYYRYFNDLISIPVLLQAFQVKTIGGSILNLIKFRDILFFIDFIIFILIAKFVFSNLKVKATTHSYLVRAIVTILMFCMGYFITSSSINAKTEMWGKGFLEVNWWNISVYNATGLLGFHGYDDFRYFKQKMLKNDKLSNAQIEEVEKWFTNLDLNHPKNPPYLNEGKNKNVIIIQAEALQSFVIGQKINGKEVTPNLNSLIKKSMYFKNSYHQTGQGNTSDAEFLANCSLYPLPSGSVYIRYSGNEYDSLGKKLRKDGYDTSVFHAHEPSFWNRYSIYPKIGFNHFYSKNDFKLDEIIGMGLSDESFFAQSLEKIKSMKRPFYSFIITLSGHYPYDIPKKYREMNLEKFEGTELGNYVHAMHYFDKSLGGFIKSLEDEGLWEDTIFVVYGDHDARISNKEELSSFLGREISNADIDDIKYKVPMLIHLPENQGAGLYTQAVGQIDIAPTLLDLLGISSDKSYMMGNNMLGNDNKLIVFRNGSFTNGKILYISSPDQIFKNGTCFDIVTRKTIDASDYKDEYDRAMKQLSVSDAVITGDLIKE